jgi:hypothetical protein
MRKFFTLAIVVALIQSANAVTRTPFTYVLTIDQRTSAGVKNSRGQLVRTLWSNTPQTAGQHWSVWDGNDDSGNPLPADIYQIVVLKSNVDYMWEGGIGNTSTVRWDEGVTWDAIGYDQYSIKLSFLKQTAFVTAGYSEGTYNLFTFDTTAPNSPQLIDSRYRDQNLCFTDIDNDGTFLYVANLKVWSGKNFITKFDLHGHASAFTNGTNIPAPLAWSGTTLSAINITTDASFDAEPTAIAVQTGGNPLAVAYLRGGKVLFFDKTTGVQTGKPLNIPAMGSATNPELTIWGAMGFTSNGRLWLIGGGRVLQVTGPGTTNTVTSPLPGLSAPMSLAVNKSNDDVVIADGGNSQQIKEFNSTTYALLRTYGKPGGYLDWDPTITNDRLMLDTTATTGAVGGFNGSWVKVDPSGGYWIGDRGNNRILHINSSGAYVNRIIFGHSVYSVAVSRNDPTRIFFKGMEYHINYGVPLVAGDADPAVGGDGAWMLAKNWNVGALGANGSPSKVSALGILQVEQLSNGRTYALMRNGPTNMWYEAELPAKGPMRFTGLTMPNGIGASLQPDGSFLNENPSPTFSAMIILRQPLIGFTSVGNPIRGPSVQVAAVGYDKTVQPGGFQTSWGGTFTYTPTSGGVYPVYQAAPKGLSGFPHLAGFRSGDSTYRFQTLREGPLVYPDFKGTFPSATGYGGHTGANVETAGHTIIAAYDGQYATWGNTFFHYSEDGLMIGQFGPIDRSNRYPVVPYGTNGNIAAIRAVQVGADIYVYATAEPGTQVQRWHISNLGSIYEATGSGTLGTAITVR